MLLGGGWCDHPIVDQLVVGPAGRDGHAVGIRHLKRFDGAQDFVHLAPDRLGVVENQADLVFGIADKNGLPGVAALGRMQHAQFAGDGIIAGDDRIGDFHIQTFFDPLHPFDV